MVATRNPSQLGGKQNIPNEFSTHDSKWQIPTCGYWKTKEQCRKLQQKESELKGKRLGCKGQLLDILEVYTQHLSYFPCSFPQHVPRPNDLLLANKLTKAL